MQCPMRHCTDLLKYHAALDRMSLSVAGHFASPAVSLESSKLPTRLHSPVQPVVRAGAAALAGADTVQVPAVAAGGGARRLRL